MINPNDPAFPHPDGKYSKPELNGLTKRELFAMEMVKAEVTGRYASGETGLINIDGRIVITSALKIADALINALNKTEEKKED